MKFSIIYTDVDNVEKPAAVERKDRGGEKMDDGEEDEQREEK